MWGTNRLRVPLRRIEDRLRVSLQRMRAGVLLGAWCVALPAWGAALDLDTVLGGSVLDGFARADRVRPFVFPADHGAHERYRSEWWYLTVNLRGVDGAEFGVQFTAFRQATAPERADSNPWTPAQLYLAHFAVTDVAGGRHREAERLSRGHPRLAGARAAPFAVWVDGWSLTGTANGLDALHLVAATETFAADLELVPVKPIVLQGDRGLSAKGPGQASYYYSLPRLAVRGRVTVDGVEHPVEGSGWFDREWSTSLLSGEQRGWDWFGLQFDSGAELMAFRMRRSDGSRDPYDHGSWVAPDGTATPLDARAFELTPTRYWRDSGGVRWPVEWTVTVRAPEGVQRFRVAAALDDQRMDTLLTYWEGLVRILDEQGRRIGAGYMELTGYE